MQSAESPSLPVENEPPALVQRLLYLRCLTDWSPVIVVSVLEQVHLALILATALSVANSGADLLFKSGGYIRGLLAPQVWPKYLDFCFFITYGVTLILSYTISETFVHRWLQVITQGGVFVLISLGILCGRPFTGDIAKETVVAAVGPNGQHHHVIPLGFLKGSLMYTKWATSRATRQQEPATETGDASCLGTSGQPELPKSTAGSQRAISPYDAAHSAPKTEV
ncbi:g4563 [Coccomyxa viridis]|uniref:G4563 protein n=1 Tax=Coccomyxa viridis TaxID=1274662 RepID=A0ABP1FQK2_9CHLO